MHEVESEDDPLVCRPSRFMTGIMGDLRELIAEAQQDVTRQVNSGFVRIECSRTSCGKGEWAIGRKIISSFTRQFI